MESKTWSMSGLWAESDCSGLRESLCRTGSTGARIGKPAPRLLLQAVRRGEPGRLQELLDTGMDPDEADSKGRTVLMLAAAAGRNDLVELLLERGASVDASAAMLGLTALTTAVLSGQTETVRLLLRRGADPNVVLGSSPERSSRDAEPDRGLVGGHKSSAANPVSSPQPGLPLLTLAVRSSSREMVEILLESGADPDAGGGGSALLCAVKCRDVEKIRLVLRQGANVNQPDEWGVPPLAYALASSQDLIAELLRDAGAEEPEGIEGIAPGFLMGKQQAAEWRRGLAEEETRYEERRVALTAMGWKPDALTRRKVESELHRAAADGKLDALVRRLGRRKDREQRNSEGKTALAIAAESGRMDCVRALLDAGADFGARDTAGRTPLMVAAVCGHAEVVNLLLLRGSDAEDVDWDGESALLLACRGGHPHVAGLLMLAGARPGPAEAAMLEDRQILERLLKREIDARSSSQMTALMGAAAVGASDLVRDLLGRGADIHARDRHGNTALSLALIRGHLRAADMLLANGALAGEDPGALLHLCWFDRELLGLLLYHGADPDARFGARTVFETALLSGHLEAARMFLAAGAHPDGPPDLPHTPLQTVLEMTEPGKSIPGPRYRTWSAAAPIVLLRLLLDYGADPDLVNGRGESPLAMAARNGDEEAVQELLARGASRHIGSPDPLQLSRRYDHPAVQELLEAQEGAAWCERMEHPGERD